MTREELRDAVAARVDADCIHGIDSERCASDVLALLDRYEREQWQSVEEPPCDERWVLLQAANGTKFVGQYNRSHPVMPAGWADEFDWVTPSVLNGGRWRELPPGPGEGE